MPQGSTCPFARVIPIDPGQPVENQIPQDVDLVHFQFKPEYPERLNKPWLMTQHGNSNVNEVLPINTVFVSRNHAQRHGSNCYVLNGLDWSEYGPVNLKAPQPYFHFLGKAAWRVKNVQGAIDVSLKAGQTLKVLGGNRLNIKRGFRFTLSPRVHFYGMVGGEQKMSLLRDSSGLIFPVRWHEPFGLAVIESLYFGAPVFATPYGALPELVNSESGVLSASEQDLAHAVESFVPNRMRNHQYAQDLYNARRMAQDYVRVYEHVLNAAQLNPQAPVMPASALDLRWD